MSAATVEQEVELILTPTESQYEQLCRDLATLRELGAQSNTGAIIAAVRLAAEGGRE